MFTKTCSKCRLVKSLTEFWGDTSRSDGRQYSCKDCMYAAGRVYEIKNRQRRNEWAKQRRIKLKAVDPAASARNTKRDMLNHLYGITPARFGEMLGDQNGLCAVCARSLRVSGPIGGDKCTVDHDHSKKKGDPGFVRGLVHSSCNSMLGHAHDDPVVLRKAATYLEQRS